MNVVSSYHLNSLELDSAQLKSQRLLKESLWKSRCHQPHFCRGSPTRFGKRPQMKRKTITSRN